MINLTDFDDIWLGATAHQERWQMHFDEQFIGNIAVDMAARAIGAMTDEQKEQVRSTNPHLWDKLQARIGGNYAARKSTTGGNMGTTDLRSSTGGAYEERGGAARMV